MKKIFLACATIFLANNIYAEETKIEKTPNEYFVFEKTEKVLDLACSENIFFPVIKAMATKDGIKLKELMVDNKNSKIQKFLSSKESVLYVNNGVAYIKRADDNTEVLVSHGFFKKTKELQQWNLWILSSPSVQKTSTCFKKEVKPKEIKQPDVKKEDEQTSAKVNKITQGNVVSVPMQKMEPIVEKMPDNQKTKAVEAKQIQKQNEIILPKELAKEKQTVLTAITKIEKEIKKPQVESKGEFQVFSEPIKPIVPPPITAKENKTNEVSNDPVIGSVKSKLPKTVQQKIEEKQEIIEPPEKIVEMPKEKSAFEIPLLSTKNIPKVNSNEGQKKIIYPHKISPEIRSCVMNETDKMILKKYPNYEIPNMENNAEFKEFMDQSLLQSISICYKKK